MKKQLTIILMLLLTLTIVYAHQPRIVFDKKTSSENPIMITEPEISRAYYGELKGKQDYYMIIYNKPFSLYLNILTPYNLENNKKDFFVEVRDDYNRQVLLIDGTQSEWKLFYESFARDYYMQGPEARMNLSSGMYYINVSSTDNRGKYTLAIGEIESFPLNEIFKTYYTVPKIKTGFFGKPLYKSFFNIVGLAMLTTLIIIIAIIILLAKIFRKKKKKRPIKQLVGY